VLAYVKVYASAEEAAHAHRVHRALPGRLDGAEPLRLPMAIAWDAGVPMLAVEAVHGRRMDGLRGDELTAAMRRYGAALAALHELPAPHGLPRFTRLDAERQPSAAGLVARARPDVAALALRLAGELAARRPDDAGAPVALHGDVHPKNGLLLPDGRIALIDLDQCGLGPAAIDLGSLVAGLRYRTLVGGDAARAAALEHALLDGYAERRALPAPGALSWHVAAALLSERALRAVNRIRPEGLEHLEDVLRAARAALAGAEA
jgi:aminoglycoside phosphotransferase (APT) family kinase protein